MQINTTIEGIITNRLDIIRNDSIHTAGKQGLCRRYDNGIAILRGRINRIACSNRDAGKILTTNDRVAYHFSQGGRDMKALKRSIFKDKIAKHGNAFGDDN